VPTVGGVTSTSSDDGGRDGDPTATAFSGPVGRPEDAKVPDGDDTLEEILTGDRPSGHVLAPDQDASDDEVRDSEEGKDSFPASDPPGNY
jgi:hypothetical protein